MENRDTSYKHFVISIIKSIFRLIGSTLLVVPGYHLHLHSDFHSIGYFLMFAGAMFFLAEVLGILEEL
jgi:hypothetical protein